MPMIGDDICVVLDVAGVPTAIRRTTLPQRVNGRPVDYFASSVTHEAVVTDDGDPDALVARTACAVRELLRPEPSSFCGIEPLRGTLAKCPVLPDSEYQTLFERHRRQAS